MDNFPVLILCNLAYVLLAILTVLTVLGLQEINSLGTLGLILAVLFLVDLLSLGVAGLSYGWVRYKKPGFDIFKRSIKGHFTHCLIKTLADFVSFTAVAVGIPYYLTSGGTFGFFCALICFWIGVLGYLSMQFYYPLSIAMFKDSAVKTFKKSLVIMWDNLGYAAYMGLRTFLEFIITVFTAGFVPGFAGINISRANMVMFLLLRYDYMDENKIDKRYLEWDAVLEDVKKNFGHVGKAARGKEED
ncbi:MAG: hypothetical protein K5634_03010 [Sphaerochaetaceae bacterium]|nr:hypothetical protein [Sphaerochaetaceae bacterium]